jgi:hypothetical protein
MPTTHTLRLTLVRAPDDDASFSPSYQRELRQFYHLARAEGGKIDSITFPMVSADGVDGLAGEFIVPFTPVAGATLSAAASAWLQGRTGRRLRLKIGDTEVEADSPGELYGLLNSTIMLAERVGKPATKHA